MGDLSLGFLFIYILYAAGIILIAYIILLIIRNMFLNPWLESKERMFKMDLEQREKERLQK